MKRKKTFFLIALAAGCIGMTGCAGNDTEQAAFMNTKWIEKFKQIDIAIAVIALVALILVTFLGVIFRYVFSKPFSW